MDYPQTAPARLKLWLARQILSRAKRAHVWAAMQLINDGDNLDNFDNLDNSANLTILPDHMLWAAKGVIMAELDQILVTARTFAFNQISESEIVSQRLARRYDPGMALNEAFNRAAEKVESVKQAEPGAFIPIKLRPGETMAQAQQRVLGGKADQPILQDMDRLDLSPRQKAALAFQEKFLRENAARGASRR